MESLPEKQVIGLSIRESWVRIPPGPPGPTAAAEPPQPHYGTAPFLRLRDILSPLESERTITNTSGPTVIDALGTTWGWCRTPGPKPIPGVRSFVSQMVRLTPRVM